MVVFALQRKPRAVDGPHLRYISRDTGVSLSVTPGIPFPLEAAPAHSDVQAGAAAPARRRRQQRLCEVSGCGRPRAYACASNGVGVCTQIMCYRAVTGLPRRDASSSCAGGILAVADGNHAVSGTAKVGGTAVVDDSTAILNGAAALQADEAALESRT